MEFEWNERKNELNIRKHGVGFLSAARVFDGSVFTFIDNRKDYGEIRYVSIGKVEETELYVVYAIRNSRHRIISARRANQNERRRYREIFPR